MTSMASRNASGVGLLVIRAWFEDHPSAQLRAVITEADVQTDTPPKRRAASSIDEVCAIVVAWLEALEDAG